ncbi:Sodium Bile acid symporter family protein [Posidoniimonas polymericola]|uniref:Sodium Bile acid symporter family protein n=1 Tax=Posidoniimonas polymericola TaxID=2528002 RepID=A0A5C5YSC2_9BACT|nr:bile acid:sodium symporter [Posidoniimonas polymericola]TWT77650.1 Sodium Bile acid symporter family protein [Posidoniimonas polymericola]
MAELAERIRRNFLWLLLPTYLIAYLLPGPGVYAANLQWSRGLPEAAAIRLPMLLVAVLLLNAALEVNTDALRGVFSRTRDLLISLAAVWLAPAVVVIIAGALFAFSGSEGGGGLLLGMILVAAMPVANSSAGWTQQSGGALAWALALVVLSILLSSVVTPGMIRLLGMSLSASEVNSVEEVVHRFSGVAFIVWVLAPTLLGLSIRRVVGEQPVRSIRPALHLSTSAAILGLNYLNGSLVLPKLFPLTADGPQSPEPALLIAALCGAVSLCLVGLLAAQLLTHWLKCDDRDRLALKFALSMKHTGLALGLASTVLADHPDAILLIILTTPIQHLIAGLVSKRYGVESDE